MSTVVSSRAARAAQRSAAVCGTAATHRLKRQQAHQTPGRPSPKGSTPRSRATAVPAATTMAPAGRVGEAC